MTARPLAGPDAVILRCLAWIVAKGRYEKSYRAQDVVRVAYDHLPHSHVLDRELRAQRRRAEEAEAENEALRARLAAIEEQARRWGQVTDTDDLPPRKVVEVDRHAYEAFCLYCEGHQRQHIATELGISTAAVSNYVSKVAVAIEADVARAAALVNRGVVSIRPKREKPPKSARRAA